MSSGKAATSSANSDNLDAVIGRYRPLLGEALLQAINDTRGGDPPAPATSQLLDDFYGQIEYHHGWRTPTFSPSRGIPASCSARRCCCSRANWRRANLAGTTRRRRIRRFQRR